MKYRLLPVLSVVPLLALSAPLLRAAGLEEILVTAQRTSQFLQDVPISVSVVSADDIMRNSSFDFAESPDLTSGISMN
ncbi:MAG: hypothetical protein HKN19_13630, partial [Halioglobus sp.]|nr:hypothetical protein [Halioglobus sp.]